MTDKESFIRFLVDCNALRFGEFQLKSGRIAPYFINTGMFDTGGRITQLGVHYAKAVQRHFSTGFDGIYGPAYKGIPLCVSTAMALSDMGHDTGYVFNRKEAKTYADKSSTVGMALDAETRLILVDDVITSGKAIRESLEVLKKNGNPQVKGIVISVDRQEKGTTDQNALTEVAETLGIPIYAIVTLDDITAFLHNKPIREKVILDDAMMEKINAYLTRYGNA
ncbi:MAG: orotate phosphoribosyltransferase [Desulfotignum sp.]